MSERGVSELFVAVVEWAGRRGALDLASKAGLWRAETQAMAGLPAQSVEINAHEETISFVPPYSALIHPLGGLSPVVMVDAGGGVMGAASPEYEGKLIAHFEAQP